MASFVNNSNQTNSNNNNKANFERAAAFVNLYRDGNKIGAMPMQISNILENRVVTLIQEDNQEALKKFLGTLQFDFKLAKPNNNFNGVEKAAAYINIGSKLISGRVKSVRSIGLRESNTAHQEIIELIRAGNTEALNKIIDEVEFSFVEVTPVKESDLAF